MKSLCRFAIAVALVAGAAARAQDVPGIERCTHETSMERRTGCLQSDVEYLQTLIARNAAAAQQRAGAAAGEIATLKMEVATLRITETGRRAPGHQRLRLMYGI